MLRVSLIGPGNIHYHFSEILHIPEKNMQEYIQEIAQALIASDVDLVLLPD